jgi:SAM-dependent methyltransferase
MNRPCLPFSPAAERNRGPILAALRTLLPAQAHVLEIAAGTGQHAEHFAAAEPGWRWQPTEANADALSAIAARTAALPNVAAPIVLDVLHWPSRPELPAFDAVYCANLLHIAPWAACPALMQGAARLLKPGGLLAIYGPFVLDDQPTAPSNLAFDADLRGRNPAWGLRRLADVAQQAEAAGMALAQRIALPANNLLLAFRLPANRPC